ncbi:MAG: transcription termination/antitermination protein NusA [Candidatus Zambryskibacteria bacterium CG_4_9_14_3_um_filter_42_9]|uniref:Transcription termination/antitermination protein NusA n=1 Tax=Candidatus Zambryskibacteria bacterium CG22_combo_CG10-13_8_21_14_all_42_17 TaxID=1975118 RepID=A0A2H0BDX3_9BACT|nr:MAG: transcription termination/antitermination protein NusA [Candidatus Zambryskibacteria bacterium CG22_combo_CG10-13_8_21_14_all_42_17]PJA36689.1 MAG: transcription termination/antitermination protein NusA [Candidatus Zambryskibacteria bacterium CG_4_9_14_3_um_filter_42_9]
MFDLKVINSVLNELEEVRGIPRASIIEAIESALATAYKKEYGKKGQIIRTTFDPNTGETHFFQVKIVVDDSRVTFNEDEESKDASASSETDSLKDGRVLYNPEHHLLLEDAHKIKKDAQLDEEIIFPIESKGDYGRIAAQTAKQVIMQKIREAEKTSVVAEFGKREGEIVTGMVQRMERGNIFVDMGRATGLLPYEEQIPGERFSQGERVRAYLYRVEESPRGVFLRLSRSHPKFLEKLFEAETPELSNGAVIIKAIAREAGYRSKIAVLAVDNHIDPVGALVGQRGVRVSTVMSELRGEKIDIIEWSAEPKKFIEEALSPAKILNIVVDETQMSAVVNVSEDQQSLAIGKGGQNVRLAAKLTGWRIDIQSVKGKELAVAESSPIE